MIFIYKRYWQVKKELFLSFRQSKKFNTSVIKETFCSKTASVDGDTLTVGEITFRFVSTPGHTDGVISIFWNAHYNGKEYLVLMPVDEESTEIVILEVEPVDEENENYLAVEDEATLEAVFAIFKDKYKDVLTFEE